MAEAKSIIAPQMARLADLDLPSTRSFNNLQTSGREHEAPQSSAASTEGTTTFQNGAAGYEGAVDIFLSENKPDRTHGLHPLLKVDGEEGTGSGKMTEALMRFDDLFGSEAGKIPLGATIVSATLVLETFDGGEGVELHRLLRPFDEESTWNSLSDGIQADNADANALSDAVVAFSSKGLTTVDVTKSLQAWADGAANYGWAFLPTSKEGWDFGSAESAFKPKLVVEYGPAGGSGGGTGGTDDIVTREDTPVIIPVIGGPRTVDTSMPAHGTVNVNDDGTLTYMPGQDYNGPDSFTYSETNSDGKVVDSTVNVTVTPVNDAPVAQDDAAATEQGQAVDIKVLLNDTDVDGDSLQVVSASKADHGTVSINADGSIQYIPDSAYTGSDSFTYTIADGYGATAAGVASISVAGSAGGGSSSEIVVSNDSYSLEEDAKGTFAVLDNDSSGSDAALAIVSVTEPGHGTAAINADGTIAYAPDENFVGSDSFSYSVSDGNGGTAVATVAIAVSGVNDAPVVATPVADQAVTADQSFSISIPKGTFTDADGDSLTYAATLTSGSALPATLTFDASSETLSGSLAAGQSLSIQISASDSSGAMAQDSFSITAASGSPSVPPTGPFSGSVTPVVETAAVAGTWDTADDPAIWIDHSNAADSMIIGTDKDDNVGGLYVFDLQGNIVDKFDDGTSLNNVDLRYGFKLGASTVDLIGATNRTTSSIDFFTIDDTTHQLSKVGSVQTGLSNVYGFSMYHAEDGKFYAFSTTEGGTVRQFEIDGSSGAITGKAVRTFDVGSQSEGIVADDRSGELYVSQENTGVWQYDADPDGGSTRGLVDGVSSGHLKSDVEGLTIYEGADGSGYLIASSQGSSSFAVYDRQTLDFLGKFTVDQGNGIDDVTETDGLDVVNVPLGSNFSQGLLVVHDHADASGAGTNFKLIPWEDVAALGDLSIDAGNNPANEWMF